MEEKPSPPDTIPKYIREGLQRQDAETLCDIIDYASLLKEHQTGLQPEEIEEKAGEEIVETEDEQGYHVVVKKIPCGKDACSSCPHGPYVYHVRRTSGGGLDWDYQGSADDYLNDSSEV